MYGSVHVKAEMFACPTLLLPLGSIFSGDTIDVDFTWEDVGASSYEFVSNYPGYESVITSDTSVTVTILLGGPGLIQWYVNAGGDCSGNERSNSIFIGG